MHVEGQYQRCAEFGEQRGQGEGAAQVLGVSHLQQGAGGFIEQGPHGGAFVVAAGGQGQHAGRVEQGRIPVEAGAGTGDLDRGARVVGDVHIGAGQAVEQDRLADVGVSDQQEGAGDAQGSAHDLQGLMGN